jgi:TatA/E family protein of Tat protein translocase
MSFGETIFLFVLALIVFGPKKLPEIARQVGKYLNEFRRASNEFKAQIEQEIAHLEREDTRKILPPTDAPSGATSRSLTPTPSEPVASVPEGAATLAAATTEASADSHASSSESPAATEAGPEPDKMTAADKVTAAASQESHA